MKLRILILVLAAAVAAPVAAQLTTLIEAVETSSSVLNVPTTPNGRLQFKRCSQRCDAEFETVRLTPATRYVIQGQFVDFLEFRKNFFNLRRTAEGYALVSFDTEDSTVTSVEVTF